MDDEIQHIDITATAVYVREAVKGVFPGQRFSVTSKRGWGYNILTVSWVDGPTNAQVEAITNEYKGCEPSDVSGYAAPRYTHLDGVLVRFDADVITLVRGFSEVFVAAQLAAYQKLAGHITVEIARSGALGYAINTWDNRSPKAQACWEWRVDTQRGAWSDAPGGEMRLRTVCWHC